MSTEENTTSSIEQTTALIEIVEYDDFQPQAKNIIRSVNLIVSRVNYFYTIIKIFVFIFFFYNFIKKNKSVCTLYFYLMFIGFVIDLLFDIPTFFHNIFTEIHILFAGDLTPGSWEWVYTIYLSVIYNYRDIFLCLWTLILCFNRLTAIVWWKSHKRIWTKFFPFILFVMFIYPIILYYYQLIDFKCVHFPEYQYAEECYVGIQETNELIISIFGQIVAVSTFIVSMFIIYFYHLQFKSKPKDQSTNSKMEQKLFIQAVISSLTYTLASLCGFLQGFFMIMSRPWLIFGLLNGILLYFFPFSAYFLIFVVSKPLRDQILAFYGFNSLKTKIFGTESTVSTTRVISIKSNTKTLT